MKSGKAKTTISTAIQRLTRLANLCNINDPEQVKETLAKLHWKNATKNNVAVICTYYYKFLGINWTRPRYTHENGLPFIPTDEEIKTLIASAGMKTATILQTLYETGARIGEILKLKWTHIDTERRTIYITAEKGSNSRILPISTTLIDMLKRIPKHSENVFNATDKSVRNNFNDQRNRTVIKLNKPRLKAIHLHTFRHYRATAEYHKTRDILHVKAFLGHRNIESTMIYINLENAVFSNTEDEYNCKVAKTTDEAIKLLEAGFTYIQEIDGLRIYRKRK